jgi:hypothetical protein
MSDDYVNGEELVDTRKRGNAKIIILNKIKINQPYLYN